MFYNDDGLIEGLLAPLALGAACYFIQKKNLEEDQRIKKQKEDEYQDLKRKYEELKKKQGR